MGERLLGVTHQKLKIIILFVYVYVDVPMSFCTLTLTFCVRFVVVNLVTKQNFIVSDLPLS